MPVILPKRFAQRHDLSFVLHDQLTSHVVEGEKAKLPFFNVQVSPADANAIKGLSGEQFWGWCETSGRKDIQDSFYYRQIIFGLLSDMCHFIYEGLRCSAKGKLSVAFSNFRKPFQDNLFYLEWILADWPSFLAKFKQGPEYLCPSKMSPENRKTLRIELISKALDKTELGRWIDPSFLYELRFDKASAFGLDPSFNQALHLVTTIKHYATSKENLNFIFCNEEDHDDLWNQLYSLLPAVLLHSLYVVRALFLTLSADFSVSDAKNDLWLTTGFLLSMHNETQKTTISNDATKAFEEMFSSFSINCAKCDVMLKFGARNMRRFWNLGEIQCMKCKSIYSILEPKHVIL